MDSEAIFKLRVFIFLDSSTTIHTGLIIVAGCILYPEHVQMLNPLSMTADPRF